VITYGTIYQHSEGSSHSCINNDLKKETILTSKQQGSITDESYKRQLFT